MTFSPKSGRFESHCICCCLLLGLVSALSPISLQAGEDTRGHDFADLSLSELMDIDVVYGASRYQEKLSDAPSSVTIVTAQDLESFGYTTLAEMMAGLRGFFTTYDHTYQYLGARGFGLPGDYNSRVLVLVDGNRQNENTTGSSGFGTDFPLDLALIDRVEVIRGPSSSVYGGNALFGIINVITKRGHQIDGVEGQAHIGSFGRRSGRVSAGGRNSSGLDWLASVSTGEITGQDRYFPEFSEDPSGGTYRDNDLDRWTRLFGRLNQGNFHFEGLYGWRKKWIPTASYETVFNDPRAWSRDDQGYLAAWYEGPVGSGFQLTSRASYHLFEYVGSWPYDYAEEGEDPWLVVNMDNTFGRWITLENQVTRELADRHKLSLGLDWQRNLGQKQSVWDEAPDYTSYLVDHRSSTNWGAYIQGDFYLLENLRANLGVRHDQYPTFGGNVNPRLALVFRPLEKTVVKALYGSAFRPPNQYELYYHDNEETSKANPELGPETIRTYELVWEQEIGTRIRWLFSLFTYENDDLIEQYLDPLDDLLVFQNAGMVRSRGFETEIGGQHPGGLRYSLSYSHQRTEYEDGARLANSPQHMIKGHLSLPLTSLEVNTGLELLYSSRRKTQYGTWTNDALVGNLTLTRALMDERFQMQAGIYNFMDNEIQHPPGSENRQEFLTLDGRSYRLTLTVRR